MKCIYVLTVKKLKQKENSNLLGLKDLRIRKNMFEIMNYLSWDLETVCEPSRDYENQTLHSNGRTRIPILEDLTMLYQNL